MWRESLFDFSAICAEDIWIFRTSEIFGKFHAHSEIYETSIGRFYTHPSWVVE